MMAMSSLSSGQIKSACRKMTVIIRQNVNLKLIVKRCRRFAVFQRRGCVVDRVVDGIAGQYFIAGYWQQYMQMLTGARRCHAT